MSFGFLDGHFLIVIAHESLVVEPVDFDVHGRQVERQIEQTGEHFVAEI